jgi:hypothetical protein
VITISNVGGFFVLALSLFRRLPRGYEMEMTVIAMGGGETEDGHFSR